MTDLEYMRLALAEAELAASSDEVPVGAVLVHKGEIIARAHNRTEAKGCAFLHAEMLAMKAGMEKLGNWRLSECCLYVTLEPCAMCAGAMVNAHLGRLVFGAFDERAGCCGSVFDLVTEALNHTVPTVGGIGEEACKALLQDYFRKKRSRN